MKKESVVSDTQQAKTNPVEKASSSSDGRARLRLVQFGLVLFFAVVIARLVQIQVVQSPKFREIAQRQYQSKIELPASRGMLYDRNGSVIASNSMFASFAADPQLAADDARMIAAKFSKLFGKPKSYYLDRLRSDSRFVWLERQVNANYLKKVNVKQLDGVVVRYEPKRLYFHDHVAGQLIGCTNIDNEGLAGLELAFDRSFKGIDGYVIFQRDGLGHARPTVDYPRVDPINGHNVSLTIDMRIQAIAEKELKKGIEINKADRGLVIVLQPRTGEVLALAQYPSIDPNQFGKYAPEDQRLRAITDVFEPGSVFKIVTASAALESGIITPERKFFAENGRYVVRLSSGKTREIRDTHPYGTISFADALAFSSNIVMAKASDLLGSERLYKMARDYGFGIATNIGFPGEVKGVLKKPMEWSGTSLNTIAYGYEVGVTPIQIAAAYGAIANDGVLMRPYIFKNETDADGIVVQETQPQAIRRVVSPKTAQTMKQLFVGVVERGTGKPAAIPGVNIAGKTGTSRKFVEGHYETGSYTASFVGFFPADDPQLVCLVMMDNPRGGSYYGGTVSAPVFRSIAEQLINTSELFMPVASAEGDSISHREERGASRQESKNGMLQRSLSGKPFCAPGTIPDVKGQSVRKALSILSEAKLEAIVRGSGIVIDQSPPPGHPIQRGVKVQLTCQPPVAASLN